MNYLRPAFLFIFLMLLSFFSCSPQKKESYTLEIHSLESSHSNGKTDILLATILSNNTDSSLSYFNMSCAWNTIYKTDNSDVEIMGPEACDGNYPITMMLGPHRVSRLDFHVLVKNKLKSSPTKFRIGINLIETKDYMGISAIPGSLHSSPSNQQGVELWSNAIEIR